MARLLGHHPGAVDAKGRVVVPAQVRPALGETVVLARGLEPCVRVFPEPMWERLEDCLRQLSDFDAEAGWIRRWLGESAEERTLDEQGRVLVGEGLRGYAGIGRAVLTVGAVTHLELWDPARHAEAYGAKVTPEWTEGIGRKVAEWCGSAPHIPVMLAESLALLGAPMGGVVVDATCGYGGHAGPLCEAVGPEGAVIGFDRDPEALAYLRAHVAPEHANLLLVHANFAEMAERVRALGFREVDGVLFDLGVSSPQLDPALGRGFSFADEQAMDMRLDPTEGAGASEFLESTSERELAAILRDYGDERYPGRVARAILEAHRRAPIGSAAELAEIVRRALPHRGRQRIDPATRSLQALRIAVNREMESLRAGLWQAFRLLRLGGTAVILSYHSGEDRMTKQFLARAARGCICPPRAPGCVCGRAPWARPLTRGAVRPGEQEVAANPRARSCRLRAAEKIGEAPDADE